MNIKFDKETDIVYLRFTDADIVESDEDKPGIIIDYDKDGNVVGIEMLEASKKMKKPGSLVYEVE
ncbi:DUF2283 domain-containing protein [Fodinibius salsisoli]|uniref:DUF2283 domain-containing protein n=1 Tax=Fodinibius salsisoli TaxID=2820877 RepID=A0ABT3PST3_9BACT|nr:DUF2283 domain-containing protein [Fodinibius salsisoli]MCW9708914.1 DUF2283 domain-containing protein [Fodinibius salsisoli]